MTKSVTIFAAFAACAMLAAVPARASCPCAEHASQSGDVCAALRADDAVFVGTVTAISRAKPAPPAAAPAIAAGAPAQGQPSPSDPPQAASAAAPSAASGGAPTTDPAAAPLLRYHFQIAEQFAGPANSELDVYSGGADAACALNFKPGVSYAVFARRNNNDGRLYTTTCDGTRPVSEALALLPQLRAFHEGRRLAAVFGVLRTGNPPFLAAPDGPRDAVPGIELKLENEYDRFHATTDENGVFNFYDVHPGDYEVTTGLSGPFDITVQSAPGDLPAVSLAEGSCRELDVEALPTGRIHGSILGPGNKPLPAASLELYRAGTYSNSRPGLWAFQGATGGFDFDHIGPGKYILVFNRANRLDPNSPFPRTFYPGVTDPLLAEPIIVKKGEQRVNLTMRLRRAYPMRGVRVHVKWPSRRIPGTVVVEAQAAHSQNPAAEEVSAGVYELQLFATESYTITAYEDVAPRRAAEPGPARTRLHRIRARYGACALPARLQTGSISIPALPAAGLADPQPDSAAPDPAANSRVNVTLVFRAPCPAAPRPAQAQ